MKKTTIGIRQADGSFYPMMDESYEGKKRFLLSMANPEALKVKIDVFRSVDGTLATVRRVGTLALSRKKNDPTDLEFSLQIDDQGCLTASSVFIGQTSLQNFTVDLSDYKEEQEPLTDQEILSNFDSQDNDLDIFELPDLNEDSTALKDTMSSSSEENQPMDQDLLEDSNFQDIELDEIMLGEDYSQDQHEDNPLSQQDLSSASESEEKDLSQLHHIFENDQDFSFAEPSLKQEEHPSWEEDPDFEKQEPFPLSSSPQENLDSIFDKNKQKSQPQKVAKKKDAPLDEGKMNYIALVFCFITIGLLIVTLLTLLFLNMIKPSRIPSIKPEVMNKQSSPLVQKNSSNVQPLNFLWNERQKLPDFTTNDGLLSLPTELNTSQFFYQPLRNERADDLSRALGSDIENLDQRILSW